MRFDLCRSKNPTTDAYIFSVSFLLLLRDQDASAKNFFSLPSLLVNRQSDHIIQVDYSKIPRHIDVKFVNRPHFRAALHSY
jgi:hypothetical protein